MSKNKQTDPSGYEPKRDIKH